MTTPEDDHPALDRAHTIALEWLASLDERRVPPSATPEQVAASLGADLPEGPTAPEDVIDLLARACEPGLTAMPSGRFFGFVIGGTHPAALAADWLVSAWDQNAGLRSLTPAHTAVEEVTEAWLLDLLGLPAESAVGFVTGGTMANFTCLAAGRDEVLRRAGWDVASRGLVGSPGVRVRRGRGAARHRRPGAALPGPGTPRAGGGGRPGTSRPLRPAVGAGGARRPSAGRRPAGRQRALRRLRPVRRGDRRGPRARCVGARGRGLRPLRRGLARAPAPRRRGRRRPTPGPPTRTRPSTSPTTAGSRSCAPARPCAPPWGCTATT